MGASRTRATQAPSKAPLEIKQVPYMLTKEKDDERIKELARKILGVVESARQAKKKRPRKSTALYDELFEPKSEEEFLGIS